MPAALSLPADPERGSDRPAGGVAGGGPLENYANNYTPPSLRDRRWLLRRGLWSVSSLERVRKCGRVRQGTHVGVRGCEGGQTGFSGLTTCGSVWSCPVCASKVLARRSLELSAGLLAWEQQGGRLALGTLTMRHHRGHGLGQQWDAALAAWNRVTRCAGWRRWLERLAAGGWVRVTEVSDGERHGWHLHLHFVLLVGARDPGFRYEGRLSALPPEAAAQVLVLEFRTWLAAKWSRCLVAAGMPGALPAGQDVRLAGALGAAAEFGGYLLKGEAYGRPASAALALELTGAMTKTARGVHSTEPVWGLAERFVETGEADLLDRWWDWETGSKGRRQMAWSKGLRDRLVLGREETDEELAARDLGGEDVARISAEGWRTVLRLREPATAALSALNEGGTAGLRRWLDGHGVDYLIGGEG